MAIEVAKGHINASSASVDKMAGYLSRVEELLQEAMSLIAESAQAAGSAYVQVQAARGESGMALPLLVNATLSMRAGLEKPGALLHQASQFIRDELLPQTVAYTERASQAIGELGR